MLTFIKLSYIILSIIKLLEELWLNLEAQLLIAFNAATNLKFHQTEQRLQNIAVQNANTNIGLENISRVAQLNEIVNSVIKSMKLLNHKIVNFVQDNVCGILKRKENFALVKNAKKSLRLKNQVRVFFVHGIVELYGSLNQDNIHIISHCRNGQKQEQKYWLEMISNVNNVVLVVIAYLFIIRFHVIMVAIIPLIILLLYVLLAMQGFIMRNDLKIHKGGII